MPPAQCRRLSGPRREGRTGPRRARALTLYGGRHGAWALTPVTLRPGRREPEPDGDSPERTRTPAKGLLTRGCGSRVAVSILGEEGLVTRGRVG